MKHKGTVSFFIGLFAMQLVLWLLSLGSVSLLFLGVEGSVELAALSSLVLSGFWGYILSKRIQTDNIRPILILCLIWILVPAVMIYFTQQSSIGWPLSLPYRGIAQTLFSAYFETNQSAFILDVLQPLLVACSYILTLLIFSMGAYIGQQAQNDLIGE